MWQFSTRAKTLPRRAKLSFFRNLCLPTRFLLEVSNNATFFVGVCVGVDVDLCWCWLGVWCGGVLGVGVVVAFEDLLERGSQCYEC